MSSDEIKDPSVYAAIRVRLSDRQMWIDLLTAVASLPEAFEILRERRRAGILPPDLLRQYARLAGGLGQEVEYRSALADLSRKAD